MLINRTHHNSLLCKDTKNLPYLQRDKGETIFNVFFFTEVSDVFNHSQRHKDTKSFAGIEDTKLAFQDLCVLFCGLILCAFVSL